MDKYEELYKYSKDVFEEEVSRFGRVEDKAAKFITLVTALLAVYALTGRQLFGDLFPASDWMRVTLVVLAGLVLLGLLVSWAFAFRALQIQGIRKAPLNQELLCFFNDNKLIDIYYGMAKQYTESLVFNRNITNKKAANIKNSFWCIIGTVAFFALFFVFATANQICKSESREEENTIAQVATKSDNVEGYVSAKEVVAQEAGLTVKDNPVTSSQQGVEVMSENENKPSQPEQPSNPPATHPERPNLDIVAPKFDVVTESFDPSKHSENKPKK